MTGRLFRAAPALILTAVVLFMAGCETSGPWRKAEPVPAEQRQAERLAQNGDYAAAAALYESAAATAAGDRRTALLLAAASHYILARELGAADTVLKRTPRPRSGDLATEFRIVDAELKLARNEPQAAVSALGAVPPAGTATTLRLRYYRVLADSASLLRQKVREADARARLAELLADPSERYANQQRLLRSLSTFTEQERTEFRRISTQHAQGWITLADALAGGGADAFERERRFREWRYDHPNHPAYMGSPGMQTGASLATFSAGSSLNLGVLLPSTGPYIRAADLIREGILAALYSLPEEQRPSVRFYDSGAGSSAVQAYQQAVYDGGDIVIGPLTKEAVDGLKQSGLSAVPVLALNRTVDIGLPLPGLLQFAFSPEEEARQVAERALTEGFRHAAVLAPTDGWGDRYVEAFRLHWEAAGGYLSVTEYDPAENHFAGPVRDALASGGDFVYVVGKQVKSRQLRTQVQYFGNANTPVFVSAKTLANTSSATANHDLNGARVPAMPWMLPGPRSEEGDSATETPPETERSANAYEPPADILKPVREGTASLEPAYGEFFAMGYDAFRLALNMEALSAGYGGIEGATGYLTIDPAGIVQRKPTWITFVNGRPQALPDY